ncbi:hypothetical protein GCM10009835_31010 [Planosporangium flavigriseum]|uniref:Uncharacterized protein n=1 Tax=Planosporangium flavigriseum TaxID=373681 RepID=A0A8J3PN36_9ACTN|nr:hypothetical protein Pfl04_39610 [Planosporangium flavigriseum]
MTTYHGGQQIDDAQATLEQHAVSSANGLCRTCGVPGPCAAYERAAKAFALALRLPRRVPGVTQPHLIGARRSGELSWFERTN